MGKQPYLLVGHWTHTSFSNGGMIIRETLAWLDTHVKGKRERLHETPVQLFVMGENTCNLCDGILRLTPGSISPESDGSLHISIEVWPTAYHFRKGQRIRIQVSSGAHPRFVRNPGSGEPLTTGTKLCVADQIVYHDPEHPSAILLPIRVRRSYQSWCSSMAAHSCQEAAQPLCTMGRVLPVTAWYWYHSTTGSLDLTTARDADPTGGLTLFLPVRDGDLISAQPVHAVRQGASASVELLIGTNSQEMNFYYVPTGLLNLIDSDEKVCASIGGRHPQPEKLVAAYRASRPGASSGELFSAIMTDWMFSRLSELIAYAQQLLAEMDIQGSIIGYVGELLFNNSGYFLNGCPT